MVYETISNVWSNCSFSGLKNFLIEKPRLSLFKGFCGSVDSFLICSLYRSLEKPLLVFVENIKQAETLAEECRSLVNEQSILLFPSRDAVPYNMKSPFGPTVESRLNVLYQLSTGKKCIVVAPASTLLQKIPRQRDFFNQIINLHINDEVTIDSLSQWLVDIGFHRENSVSDIGTFSIRGGIVDIYPFLTEHPFRIEFWGDRIESIRLFDVFSQKTLDHINSALIVPMKEFCFSSQQITSAIENIRTFLSTNSLDDAGLLKLEHQWKIGEHEGLEWFLHWFNLPSVSLLDYLSPETHIIWNDSVALNRRYDETIQNYRRHLERVPPLFHSLLSPPENLLHKNEYLDELFACFPITFFDTFDVPETTVTYIINFSEQPQLPREVNIIKDNLKLHLNKGYRCILVSPNSGHADRMKELLDDIALSIEFVVGYLTRGHIDHGNRMVFYAESRLTSRPTSIRKVKKRSSSIPLPGFDALTPNDYVVHEDHGIARFLGIEHISAGDLKQDCMVLHYAEGTKIYVPVHDFFKVQKYIGKDSTGPTLSKIGTASWEKLKVKTRESLKEMAAELIELYAKRQFLEGLCFQPDTIWQREFEEAFIFDETVDQLRAVSDIKKDMESSKPMDRLVCGDVGFGKTEVAMRAAFKAVMSGFQVAVLSPTTILAAQHFTTFSDRMCDFPVKIATMSRFVKVAQQKENLQKISDGKVDIVIGTHRLLSKDIVFKNLGLLIIDEEQRFGVNHKERIKQLRYSLDVLSLTATPIPRTMQMSLIGARDLSIINTPPQNRLPIETIVCPYHDEQVKSAIEDELDRGGQIYFVNNRIQPLDYIKDTIEQLVPKARVIIAHGQMDEELLEKIMKEFVAGRYDVLLSTVIIENGLDIPNVNTIIVNRADTLGLSQLYQLRGRVGRSSEQAYAFFFTPPFRDLNDIALKRLKALEQYTELGSGFQIAMRDLEIRGAGNILGTRQHGFIEGVGFELYCRILQDAIEEINGNQPLPKPIDVTLEIPLEAFIPNEYIPDGTSRISLYQELSSLPDLSAISDFEQSLLDRFGPLPKPVISLVILLKIKALSGSLAIKKLILSLKGLVNLYFDGTDQEIQKIIGCFILQKKYLFKIDNSAPVNIHFQILSIDITHQCLELIELLKIVLLKTKEV